MAYPISRYTFLPIFRYFIKSIEGLANLPDQTPFIIASNHISQSDPFLIIAALFPKYKKKVHYIANQGGYGPWFAKHFVTDWAGCILVNPELPGNQCLETALEWLERGDLVGLFPEAERVPDANFLRQGKTGVARLALRSGRPVLPIGIITKGEVHRQIEGRKKSKPRDVIKDYLIHGTKSRIVIGQPLHFDKRPVQEINYKLLRSTTDQIMKTIGELTSIPLSNVPHRYPGKLKG